MIAINKPKTIPNHLTKKGIAATTANNKLLDASLKNIISIKSKIYGHPSVKEVLREAQFNKCCFCEKDQSDEYAAVEHFRPKMGYYPSLKRQKNDQLQKPAYYWLAYDWDNLFFVCGPCNNTKGNFFPLSDESKRAKKYKDDYTREEPLLLNPSGTRNPRDHIYFDEFGLPRSRSKFGKATIQICGLDRSALVECRMKVIKALKTWIDLLNIREHICEDIVIEIKRLFDESISPERQFSAMALDYIKYRNFVKDW